MIILIAPLSDNSIFSLKKTDQLSRQYKKQLKLQLFILYICTFNRTAETKDFELNDK